MFYVLCLMFNVKIIIIIIYYYYYSINVSRNRVCTTPLIYVSTHQRRKKNLIMNGLLSLLQMLRILYTMGTF